MKRLIGLERLNKEAIEERSLRLFLYFDPNFFLVPQPTPLKKIAQFLIDKHSMKFSFDNTLGFTDDGKKLFGIYMPKKKSIFIDQSLQSDENKFNFTLGHELGHLALHRKLRFEEDDEFIIGDYDGQN